MIQDTIEAAEDLIEDHGIEAAEMNDAEPIDIDDEDDEDDDEAEAPTVSDRVKYSPEDNKLRLYVGRVPREDYLRLIKAGFVSTPKQTCDFAATWTPSREDLAREFMSDESDDIGDEDYSLEDRAADRAERFAGYRDKRRGEAGELADRYEEGPQVFGHQNEARAARQARRADRTRTKAVSQWDKAVYWQQRTTGVIRNALYKTDARTRRGRILTLEAEQRSVAGRAGDIVERWQRHYEMRLSYERAMLENEGGSAAAADMEVGGWIRGGRPSSCLEDAAAGWKQILQVFRSPVTKRITSVKVLGTYRSWRTHESAKLPVTINVERLGADCYRPPTDAEREAFAKEQKESKAAKKATTPKAPPLINPTREEAQKLQDIWNAKAAEAYAKGGHRGDAPRSEVFEMTQAEYSARSRGSYSPGGTVDIKETTTERGRVTVFSVRKFSGSGFCYHTPNRVVVLTDKPQKQIPWAEIEKTLSEQPNEVSMFEKLPEIKRLSRQGWMPDDSDKESQQLLEDAKYVGWFRWSSMSQFGMTEAGEAAWRRFEAEAGSEKREALPQVGERRKQLTLV